MKGTKWNCKTNFINVSSNFKHLLLPSSVAGQWWGGTDLLIKRLQTNLWHDGIPICVVLCDVARVKALEWWRGRF